MSNISIFNFKSAHPVRIQIDEYQKIWFCVIDICRILGYTNSNKTLKDHCFAKGVTKRYTPTKGGQQELMFISEGNLYRLIIKSRKEEARDFESWVCDEVLPTIRKTGSYSVERVQPTGPRQIAPAEFAMIQKAIDGLSRYVGLSNNQLCTNLYRYFRQQFNLNDLMQMNVEQLRQALEFIASVSKQAHATWMKFSREQYNLFFSIVNPKRVLPPWQAEMSA